MRIVSTNAFRLRGLTVSECGGGRYATIVVAADSAAGELLRKRLNQVVSVEKVRVHDPMCEARPKPSRKSPGGWACREESVDPPVRARTCW